MTDNDALLKRADDFNPNLVGTLTTAALVKDLAAIIRAQQSHISALDHGCVGATKSMDAAEAERDAIEIKAGSLFDAIAHGDDDHREWLKRAIADHFAGRPVERPRGSGNLERAQAAEASRDAWRERAEKLTGAAQVCRGRLWDMICGAESGGFTGPARLLTELHDTLSAALAASQEGEGPKCNICNDTGRNYASVVDPTYWKPCPNACPITPEEQPPARKTCSKCGGSGYILRHFPEAIVERASCPNCNGKGDICALCENTEWQSWDEQQKRWRPAQDDDERARPCPAGCPESGRDG